MFSYFLLRYDGKTMIFEKLKGVGQPRVAQHSGIRWLRLPMPGQTLSVNAVASGGSLRSSCCCYQQQLLSFSAAAPPPAECKHEKKKRVKIGGQEKKREKK